MRGLMLLTTVFVIVLAFSSCKKENNFNHQFTYYEVGFKGNHNNWRDSSIIVRTSNQQLIKQIETQLTLPVENRKLVVGTLIAGNGGYNKNGSHEFKWRFKEDDWQLADATVEIYDGKPYTDVDLNLSYWLSTVKRFGSWGSYIKRKLPGKT